MGDGGGVGPKGTLMIFTAHDGEDRSGADVSQVKMGGYTPPSLTAAQEGHLTRGGKKLIAA